MYAGSIKSNNTATADGLHVHFLKARNAWFEKTLEDAKNTEGVYCLVCLLNYSFIYFFDLQIIITDVTNMSMSFNILAPERLLRRVVELHRIHLFNVLTQHKSIFLSDSQESKIKDDELSGTSALSCWLKLKVIL